MDAKIPKEISTFKEKLLFNLNLRQTICVAGALTVNVPLYIYLRNVLKMRDSKVSWIVLLIAAIFFSIGFFNYNGMPTEKFIYTIIKNGFILPQKRVYKNSLLTEYMEENKKDIELLYEKRKIINKYKLTLSEDEKKIMQDILHSNGEDKVLEIIESQIKKKKVT
jgi:hypothetical protein